MNDNIDRSIISKQYFATSSVDFKVAEVIANGSNGQQISMFHSYHMRLLLNK